MNTKKMTLFVAITWVGLTALAEPPSALDVGPISRAMKNNPGHFASVSLDGVDQELPWYMYLSPEEKQAEMARRSARSNGYILSPYQPDTSDVFFKQLNEKEFLPRLREFVSNFAATASARLNFTEVNPRSDTIESRQQFDYEAFALASRLRSSSETIVSDARREFLSGVKKSWNGRSAVENLQIYNELIQAVAKLYRLQTQSLSIGVETHEVLVLKTVGSEEKIAAALENMRLHARRGLIQASLGKPMSKFETLIWRIYEKSTKTTLMAGHFAFAPYGFTHGQYHFAAVFEDRLARVVGFNVRHPELFSKSGGGALCRSFFSK